MIKLSMLIEQRADNESVAANIGITLRTVFLHYGPG